PTAEQPRLAWFVREPFPSVATGTALNFGVIAPPATVSLVSEMNEDGVIFGDGIESDRVEFLSGQSVTIKSDPQRLRLVVPAGQFTAPAGPEQRPARRRVAPIGPRGARSKAEVDTR